MINQKELMDLFIQLEKHSNFPLAECINDSKQWNYNIIKNCNIRLCYEYENYATESLSTLRNNIVIQERNIALPRIIKYPKLKYIKKINYRFYYIDDYLFLYVTTPRKADCWFYMFSVKKGKKVFLFTDNEIIDNLKVLIIKKKIENI